METEKGKKVTIRFVCRLSDGKVYLVGPLDTLDFVIGAGTVPAVLETGMIGMKPGERRTIRLPASEADRFPFPKGSHFALAAEVPPAMAYDFGPGEGGDVAETIPSGRSRQYREPLPVGADLYFEIEMLAVEDPTPDWQI